nr:hypothetical protein [Mucilaginibacter sp. X4EP1]
MTLKKRPEKARGVCSINQFCSTNRHLNILFKYKTRSKDIYYANFEISILLNRTRLIFTDFKLLNC